MNTLALTLACNAAVLDPAIPSSGMALVWKSRSDLHKAYWDNRFGLGDHGFNHQPKQKCYIFSSKDLCYASLV